MPEINLLQMPDFVNGTFHVRTLLMAQMMHDRLSKKTGTELTEARQELSRLESIAQSIDEKAVRLNITLAGLTDVAARLRWAKDQFRPLRQNLDRDAHYGNILNNSHGIAHLLAVASLILHDLDNQLELSEIPVQPIAA